MQKKDVQHRLFREWKRLLQTGKKANVSAVCKAAGLSRQTFYVHFENLALLSAWSFRSMIADALITSQAPNRFLCMPPPDADDPFPRLYYYYRRAEGARRLDCSVFFQECSKVLQAERDYYIAVLRSPYGLEFRRYVHDLYEGAFESDVKTMLGGRTMPQRHVSLIADTMAYASLDCYFDELVRGNQRIDGLVLPDMPNLIHDGAHYAVEAYYTRQGDKLSALRRSRSES